MSLLYSHFRRSLLLNVPLFVHFESFVLMSAQNVATGNSHSLCVLRFNVIDQHLSFDSYGAFGNMLDDECHERKRAEAEETGHQKFGLEGSCDRIETESNCTASRLDAFAVTW